MARESRRRGPVREADARTQGSQGRPAVTPDRAGAPKEPTTGTPGGDTGPAEFGGADPAAQGREVPPRTEEDRRHLEAQRAALGAEPARRGGRFAWGMGMGWAIAAVVALVVLFFLAL
jgi:hypothetical protein